jgi:crotonobetainyl-CoA:carnitine CoA-transferase CaiB-like acyl-CoA transferase
MTSQAGRVIDEVRRIGSQVPGPTLPVEELELSGTGELTSAFEVEPAVLAAAAASNLAFGVPSLDRSRAVALCAGRALVDGQPCPTWAELSGYYEAGDGEHIQLHANFPHHADGIVATLGCEPSRAAVEAAIGGWTAADLEARLVGSGLIGARLRTMEEWDRHPHALATAELPLLSVTRIGDGPPRSPDRRLRVLDCSRVLAGPVAGSTFAAHGADVLRVGSGGLPWVEVGVLTTGSGKRNAFVELDQAAGRARFTDLLAGADVWVDAYRPGAFADRGFPPEAVGAGGVVVQISAFDWIGPWAGRRGFDSIVQSTTGIVRAGSTAAGADHPVPLPVQALDYCTGLLAGFAARQLIAHQARHGGTWLVRLSLLRTRNWLVGLGGPRPFEPKPIEVDEAAMETFSTAFGEVTTAGPISGRWPHGPQPLGSSPPDWSPGPD